MDLGSFGSFFVSSQISRKTQKQETPASTCQDTRPCFQEQHIQLSSSEVTEGDQTSESTTDDNDIVHDEVIPLTKYELIMLVMLGLGIVYRTEITNTKYYVYIYIYVITQIILGRLNHC